MADEKHYAPAILHISTASGFRILSPEIGLCSMILDRVDQKYWSLGFKAASDIFSSKLACARQEVILTQSDGKGSLATANYGRGRLGEH